MQVSKSAHAIKLPFSSNPASKGKNDRFVYAYAIMGRRLYLIDSGVKPSFPTLTQYLADAGRSINDVKTLFFTHSHPDHIGGGPQVIEASGCSTAAHPMAAPFVEDVDLQHRTRPTATFYDLVGGSLKLDRRLNDGDRVLLDDDGYLDVLHTPGHSDDLVSLWFEQERVLFSGDAIPKSKDRPIWEDPVALVASVKRLKSLPDVEAVCSSWHDPVFGSEVKILMETGLDYVQEIHGAVRRIALANSGLDREALCTLILDEMGFPNFFNVRTTILAHMAVSDRETLV